MRFLFALLMLSVLSNLADAAQLDESGNVFLEKCTAFEKANSDTTTKELLEVNQCLAYLRGVMDGVEVERRWLGGGDEAKYPLPFCIPPDVSTGQILRITLKYIRNNPEIAHYTTAMLVVNALGFTFPCTTTSPKKE